MGAAAGAALSVPALYVASPPQLMLALALVLCAATLAFRPRSPARALGLALGVLGLLGLDATHGLLEVPTARGVTAPGRLVERWSPLARVIGFQKDGAQSALLFYDRVYAPIPGVGAGLEPSWKSLLGGPQSVGFELVGPGRTLIIGGGGGRDIHLALSLGQTRVDVIELIDANRAVVDEDFGDVSGRPYSHPRVHTVIGDGRSVLARREVRYDQIHIGFTDTLTPGAAHGFALLENNLYTVEAFVEYLEHLKPRGILNVSRLLNLVGEEALRATVLTLAALRRLGIEHPERHVVVLLGRDLFGPLYGTILARRQPYTDGDLAEIRRLAAERAVGIAFAPGGPCHGPWQALADAPDEIAFCRSYPLDVCPPTDDRPFFFSMQRLRDLGRKTTTAHYAVDPLSVLGGTLAILVILAAVFLGLPLLLEAVAPLPPRPTLYFALLGIGFMFVEIPLVQRLVLLLGYPTYSLTVVLSSLLLFAGLGSSLSARARIPPPGRLFAAIALLVAVHAAAAPALIHACLDLPLAARIAVAVALIAPVGLLLGMPMPLGLRALTTKWAGTEPYAWAINGLLSVVGSVLAVFLSIYAGFTWTLLTAAALYGLAGSASRSWPVPRTAPGRARPGPVATNAPTPKPPAAGGADCG